MYFIAVFRLALGYGCKYMKKICNVQAFLHVFSFKWRFAAKRPPFLPQNRAAFCRKTPRILPQNATRFAAKCNTFCGKMPMQTTLSEGVSAKKGKISFVLHTIFRTFAPKWLNLNCGNKQF